MKISVIIPVKNRELTIKQSIESVLLSNYDNLEIIVVDNNSTDKTGEIVKRFENVIYVKNNKDQEVVLVKEAGGVDYMKGEVVLNTINITSTQAENNIIEVQAFPESKEPSPS